MATSSPSEVSKPASETAVASASAHAPSLAGSVIEAKDGMGGSNFIRIQNMSATGTLLQLLSQLCVFGGVCLLLLLSMRDDYTYLHSELVFVTSQNINHLDLVDHLLVHAVQ
jgi:hypothetical protein